MDSISLESYKSQENDFKPPPTLKLSVVRLIWQQSLDWRSKRQGNPAKHGKHKAMINEADKKFLQMAFEEAKAGYLEGGCPIGSVLARGDKLVSRGRNQRVQAGDPIAHGEMDALRKAGRQKTYKDTTLYTSLSPCMMCAGTIVQFGIPRVVVGDNKNFGGNEEFLRSKGVEVIVVNNPDCIALMAEFIREKPALWNEDIAED